MSGDHRPVRPAGRTARHDDPVPVVRVLRGQPTAAELAALVAVLAARGASSDPPARPDPGLWGRPVLRAPLTPGPGAWRASALPR